MGFDKEKLWGWEEFLAAQGFSLALARYLSMKIRERGTIQDLRRLLAPPYLADKRFDSIAGSLEDGTTKTRLSHLGIISNHSLTGKFVVDDHFKVDMSDEAEVPISYLCGEFDRYFKGLVENERSTASFSYHVLNDKCRNEELMDFLGHGRIILSCGILWKILQAQKRIGYHMDGPLQVNHKPNVFFAKDFSEKVRNLMVVWDGDAWQISSFKVENFGAWAPGCRVFSCSPFDNRFSII